VFAHVHMPSLGGAAEWLNCEPLGPAELPGHVVLVNFWTLTCTNWLRTEPYIRAWSQAYRTDGVVLIGVHTPEFSSEHQIGRVRQATKERISTTRRGRQRLRNLERLRRHYWPALHFVDTDGVIRDHHVGEDAMSNPSAPSSGCSIERELVCVEGLGVLIGVLGFPP
jgi:thiol-disulfide isomerase/thioredoxin